MMVIKKFSHFNFIILSLMFFQMGGLISAQEESSSAETTASPKSGELDKRFKATRIPDATGHPKYLTHTYSQPIVVDGNDLYMVYQGNDAHTSSSIVKYDGTQKKWSAPVLLGGGKKHDPHYYPSLVQDQKGHLHVFYGCHSDPIRYRRSTRPRDISEWDPEELISRLATYPRPFVLKDGRILVFHRSSVKYGYQYRYGYIESTDRGQTWSAFRVLIDDFSRTRKEWIPYVGGVYIEEKKSALPVIHIAWSWWDYKRGESGYDDVLYAAFPMGESVWREATGTEHPLPVTYNKIEAILRGRKIAAEDLTLDEQGNPYILFFIYPEKPYEMKLAKFTTEKGWNLFDPLPEVELGMFNARLANPNGQVTMVTPITKPTPGLILMQQDQSTENFSWRQLDQQATPYHLHPVITSDLLNNLFHIFWTEGDGEEPGQLVYGRVPIQ